MKNRIVITLYLLLLTGFTFLVTRCTSSNTYSSGIIEYEISFPDFNAEEHPLTAAFLPKKQVVSFAGNQMHSQIKKAVFELNVITDSENRRFYSDYLFNERKHFVGQGDELSSMLSANKGFRVQLTDITDTLLGFTIHQAIATSNENEVFELWYTKQIVMTNPNWFNPYHEVPGMLMRYTIEQNGVKMKFEAKSFSSVKPEAELFNPTQEGTKIDYTSFTNELTELFHNLIQP
jgi:hypothetical protein